MLDTALGRIPTAPLVFGLVQIGRHPGDSCCGLSSLIDELCPSSRRELISTSRKLISPDGTNTSWPVQQHCWHKTEQLPRPRLAQLITNRLRPVSLCRGRAKTLPQSRSQKMRATLQHGQTQQEEISQIDLVQLLPRTFWKCWAASSSEPLALALL